MRNVFLTIVLLPLLVFGQNDTLTKKQLRRQRPAYITVGLGAGYSYFRDFATSPLIYGGVPLNISTSYFKTDNIKENELAFNYHMGSYYAYVDNYKGNSLGNVFSLNYSRLYSIQRFSVNKWHVRAGGLVDASFIVRSNEELGNNSFGAEMFGTLFASGKVIRDISREQVKHKKLWFIHYTLKPQRRSLSFRLNMAVINTTLRNGYVYAGQSYLVNNLIAFDNYEITQFSGYRMSSCLDYTYYLDNKNGFRLSYVWDAYKTGGSLDKFEMAHHTLKYSILFSAD